MDKLHAATQSAHAIILHYILVIVKGLGLFLILLVLYGLCIRHGFAVQPLRHSFAVPPLLSGEALTQSAFVDRIFLLDWFSSGDCSHVTQSNKI